MSVSVEKLFEWFLYSFSIEHRVSREWKKQNKTEPKKKKQKHKNQTQSRLLGKKQQEVERIKI